MPPIMLFGADEPPAADIPVAPGVNEPLFAERIFAWDSVFCEVGAGMRVLSRCVEEAEDSLAESGWVACFKAEGRVSLGDVCTIAYAEQDNQNITKRGRREEHQ